MNKISKKIFVIVFSGLLASAIVPVSFQLYSYNRVLDLISVNKFNIANESFKNILTSETQKLSLALDFLLADNTAKRFFKQKNIDGLYAYSKPKFEQIRDRYSITHLYYIMPEPDMTCFLRVHNRQKNNDLITRFTYKNAVKTKKVASGLELGKTAFALRVVKPYYDKGNIIGYMEVGQEIEHFFDLLKIKTGDEFIVTVDKNYLDQEKWKSAQETNPHMSSWDNMEKDVIIASTSENISLSSIKLNNISNESSIISNKFKINNKDYVLGQFPLIDAGNRKVGLIYFAHDISEIRATMVKNVKGIIAVFILLSIIYGIVTIILIRKSIVEPIEIVVEAMDKMSHKQMNFRLAETRTDEIGKLFISINKMNIVFKEIMEGIGHIASSVLNASNQLSLVSQQISERVNEQASTTEEVATSMQQMLAIIDSNTEKAEITGKTSANSANEMKQSNEIFLQTINSISEINEKIFFISQIADKTDILAINAALEARRAGESGLGFAVVANEIRKLADKTQIASIEINELSTKGYDISKLAGEKLKKTIPEIIKSAELVKSIVEASKEQQSGVETINSSIQQISEITNENSASAEEMSVAAKELSTQAKQLKKLISESMEEIFKPN